jgi:hypothetical protein
MTRKRSGATQAAAVRPAGMQHMGEALYQLLRQAIVEQAPAPARPEAPQTHLVGAWPSA